MLPMFPALAGAVIVTVVCTVTLSIVLHGITANPVATLFAARTSARVG